MVFVGRQRVSYWDVRGVSLSLRCVASSRVVFLCVNVSVYHCECMYVYLSCILRANSVCFVLMIGPKRDTNTHTVSHTSINSHWQKLFEADWLGSGLDPRLSPTVNILLFYSNWIAIVISIALIVYNISIVPNKIDTLPTYRALIDAQKVILLFTKKVSITTNILSFDSSRNPSWKTYW